MSARPLGAFGTMIRTGLPGYAGAETWGKPGAAKIASARPAAAWSERSIRIMITSPPAGRERTMGRKRGHHMKRDVVEIARPERPVRERINAEEWRLRCGRAAAHPPPARVVLVDLTHKPPYVWG